MTIKKKWQQALQPFLGSLAIALLLLSPAFGQHTSTHHQDLKNVKSLQAEVQISAGTLKLSAHNQLKTNARFTYTRDNWKPQVSFTQQAGVGHLSIKQPEDKNMNMKDKDQNDWEIRLPQAVLMDLTLRMGAGEATVDLHGAKLNRLKMEAGAGEFKVNLANTSVARLEVNAGVGELTLDLTGNRTANLQASINGGIGGLNLVLPRQTGVRVKVNGLGGIDRTGLKKQGSYYVNEAYGKTTHSLDITVNGGLGNVELALEK